MTDKTYYDETDDIPLYWEKRYVEWAAHPDWGVFPTKAAWFRERFDHLLPPPRLGDNYHREPATWVLDWGCGNAMYAVPLLERYTYYHGYESSPTALAIARQYFRERPEWVRMHLDQVDLADLKPPAGLLQYDLVVSITVLQHQPVPLRLKMIERIKDLLRPAGRYLGLEFIGDTAAYDMPRMAQDDWRAAWLPREIIWDCPPAHPAWRDDNVWYTR